MIIWCRDQMLSLIWRWCGLDPQCCRILSSNNVLDVILCGWWPDSVSKCKQMLNPMLPNVAASTTPRKGFVSWCYCDVAQHSWGSTRECEQFSRWWFCAKITDMPRNSNKGTGLRLARKNVNWIVGAIARLDRGSSEFYPQGFARISWT